MNINISILDRLRLWKTKEEKELTQRVFAYQADPKIKTMFKNFMKANERPFFTYAYYPVSYLLTAFIVMFIQYSSEDLGLLSEDSVISSIILASMFYFFFINIAYFILKLGLNVKNLDRSIEIFAENFSMKNELEAKDKEKIKVMLREYYYWLLNISSLNITRASLALSMFFYYLVRD